MFQRFKDSSNKLGFFSTTEPMADVVFLLLIFFMITSSFALEPGISVDLPRALTSEEQPRQRILITITRDRTILLNDDIVSFDNLAGRLEALLASSRDSVLVVRADRDVPHGFVVRALDISREVGAGQLAIATESLR
ncbi:MAG: biopolymer transporter ExbD [Elusimicrobia bacterium]|nr:biopolymer transporter ExbD [Elusimicrobiota bacterium]